MQGEPFRIIRQRAPWYPPPLFDWMIGRMQDKDQTDYKLSHRVQLDSHTGLSGYLFTYLLSARTRFLSVSVSVCLSVCLSVCRPQLSSLIQQKALTFR